MISNKMRWVVLLAALCIACSGAAAAAVTPTTTLAASTTSDLGISAVSSVRRRSLAVYALYNLPKLTISFRTSVPTTSPLLESGVSASEADAEFGSVLREVTKRFLITEFRERIAAMALQQEFAGFYAHLQTIDLEASELYIDDGLGAGTEGEDLDNTRRHRYLAGQQLAVTVRYAATVAFEEPNSRNDKPSNGQVAQTFGLWMDDAFSADRDEFLKALLQQYESYVLREITSLRISVEEPQSGATDSTNANVANANNDPNSTRSIWIVVLMIILAMLISGTVVGLALHVRHRKRGPWWDSRSYVLDYPESDGDLSQIDGSNVSDSPVNSGARSVLKASDLYLSKHRPDLFQAVNGKAAQFFPSSSTEDPVTGRARRTSLFSQYLYGENDGTSDGNGEGHDFKARDGPPLMSVVGRNHSEVSSVTSGGLSAFRNYIMPSNPFDYIYGTGRTNAENKEEPPPALASNKGPPRPNRITRRSSSFTPRGTTDDFSFQTQRSTRNFAAAGDVDDMIETNPSYDDGADHFDPNDVPAQSWPTRPIASIWRNISNMWEGGNTTAIHDDSILFSGDGIQYTGSNEEQGIVFAPVTNNQFFPNAMSDPPPEDDLEEDYPFAFRDFPRHDGTPCLIFSDGMRPGDAATKGDGNNYNGMFVITDDDELEDVPITPRVSLSRTTPVSNMTFQKMLSQQTLKSIDSFGDENDDDALDDETIIDSDDEDDNGSAEKTRRNKEFLDRLDRVMAQRHRQYEKRAIVEKHREARARERSELREKERRDRHSAMERGINELESTLLSPASVPATHISTFHGSPKKHIQSPLHHRQNSSSSIRSTSSIRSASPVTTIPARLKGMPDLKINPKLPDLKISTKVGQSPYSYSNRSANGGDTDEISLEKLSMPPMGPKYPSPNSVMDDLTFDPLNSIRNHGGRNGHPLAPTSNQSPPIKIRRHHRVHSFSHDENKMDASSHGGSLPLGSSHSSHHRRVYSGHAIPTGSHSAHRRTPSQGHVRTHSSGSHHRRSSSTSDDVLVHGIYAQTRFI